jgi:hypothetical protein
MMFDHIQPGADRIDADTLRREIHCLVARQLQDGGLGHWIEPAPRLRHPARDRTEIDDCAAVPRELIARLLHEDDRADDIHVQAFQPFRACRVRPVVQIRAGNVHQKVDAPEAVHRRRDQGRDLVVLAQVAGTKRHAFALKRATGLGVDIGHHHPDARRVERIDDRLANLGGATRHDGDLPFQSAHA